MRWRTPHTIPPGQDVIVAYRWTNSGSLHVTIGRLATCKGGGVIESPDGCYLPCCGWTPMPTGGLHDAWIPLHLRAMLHRQEPQP